MKTIKLVIAKIVQKKISQLTVLDGSSTNKEQLWPLTKNEHCIWFEKVVNTFEVGTSIKVLLIDDDLSAKLVLQLICWYSSFIPGTNKQKKATRKASHSASFMKHPKRSLKAMGRNMRGKNKSQVRQMWNFLSKVKIN